MQIDRAAVMRGLELVTVSGINRIVISKEGKVCHPSPDQTVLIYGNLELGELDDAWALPDISLFLRMLKVFTATHVDLVRGRNCFTMAAEKVKWTYRLGNAEAIQTLAASVVEGIISTLTQPIELSIDFLKKVCGIQAVIHAKFIHFVSHDGKFGIVVGEKETYAGSTDVDHSLDNDFDIKIPADRFTEIVGKIDEPVVGVRFNLTENKRAIRIGMSKFSWIIGGIAER